MIPRSPSAFAVALADDLLRDLRACEVRPWGNDGSEACGRPGGRAIAICPQGHRETAIVCRPCIGRLLYCSECASNRTHARVQLITEVG